MGSFAGSRWDAEMIRRLTSLTRPTECDDANTSSPFAVLNGDSDPGDELTGGWTPSVLYVGSSSQEMDMSYVKGSQRSRGVAPISRQ